MQKLVQLTRDRGQNAVAHWASSGRALIVQSQRPPFACDQIYRLPVDGARATLLSTGLGSARSSSFLPGDREILYASTHRASGQCPALPADSTSPLGPIGDEYDIYLAKADGSNLRPLASSPRYDAEASVCATDGSIVFSSTRNGDLDLYRMDREGGNLVQLTDTPGYDGGASFSPDCSQIVWRASRPVGDDLRDYRKLLAEGLVRPSKLEIFVAKSDGSDVRQITYLDAASFAPSFFPDGKRVIFTSNVGDSEGREFDLWAVHTDGTRLERITYADGFDGFPAFSPDGSKLAFSSARNAGPTETDVFVADWRDEGQGERVASGADSYRSDVAWLADDAREGRGVGTKGIEASADWLAERFAKLGLAPGNGDSFFQSLKIATAIKAGSECSLTIGKKEIARDAFRVLGFSAAGSVKAPTLPVGFGIEAAELGIDDYKGKDMKGKIAVLRRYTPDTELFKDRKNYDKYSSLHRKAFTAREKGAVAVIVVNGGPPGVDSSEEAEMPILELDRLGAIGIPVIVVRAEQGASLLKAPRTARLRVDLDVIEKPSRNVVAVLHASGTKSSGSVFIGAHYDHLGFGGEHSLAPDAHAVHNGADDNASGVAALLNVAETLVKSRAPIQHDVVFVAFTGEESGLLGSKYFVEHLSASASPVAMLNMDMVGRLRSNRLSVMGAGTAREWPKMAQAACDEQRIECIIGGEGYGPSDHSSFTAVSVPVLYFSTGAHSDYHKPSDDSERINAIGGKRVADLVAGLAIKVASRSEALAFRASAKPSSGDRRSFGASLGTIPDYSGDTSQPGMLLSGVRPGGAADQAGIRAGDRILSIGDTSLQSVKDLVYVLQAAKPGDSAVVKVERSGKVLMLKVEYQKSAKRRH